MLRDCTVDQKDEDETFSHIVDQMKAMVDEYLEEIYGGDSGAKENYGI